MAAPSSLLERIVSQRVVLRLKDHRTLTGRLLGVDEHLNLVLDETEERTPEGSRRLGRVVLRGSNVVILNAPGGAPAKGVL
ncbi:MAG: LSM domain-containing protein [Thermoplasmata archaeon]